MCGGLQLGPLTVWVTPDGLHGGKKEDRGAWQLVYEGEQPPSFATPTKLPFKTPVQIKSGTSIGM